MTTNAALKNGDPLEINDPISQGMLEGAHTLRKKLLAVCGTDLTKVQRMNEFWYAGANNSSLGDYRLKRPWEWIWKVAAGMSGGKGPPVKDGSGPSGCRSSAPHIRPRKILSAEDYVDNFIENSMFSI